MIATQHWYKGMYWYIMFVIIIRPYISKVNSVSERINKIQTFLRSGVWNRTFCVNILLALLLITEHAPALPAWLIAVCVRVSVWNYVRTDAIALRVLPHKSPLNDVGDNVRSLHIDLHNMLAFANNHNDARWYSIFCTCRVCAFCACSHVSTNVCKCYARALNAHQSEWPLFVRNARACSRRTSDCFIYSIRNIQYI